MSEISQETSNEVSTPPKTVERSSESEVPKYQLSWDEYFMVQAITTSFKSKDPSTKVGCVLVDSDNRQISMGYNGFISGIDESQLPWGKDPEAGLIGQKYGYIVHAEANAILHSSSNLEGVRCYTTLFPCNECAKLIASKKISQVIYLSDKHQNQEQTIVSRKIFNLMNIEYRQLTLKTELIDQLRQHFDRLLSDL